MPEGRIISPVGIMCDCHSEERSDRDVVDVVSVVFAAGDGDEGGAEEGREGKEDAGEVCAWTVDVALACEEEGEIAQTTKGKTAMAAGETAPSIVERVVVGLGADFVRDELVSWRAGRGLASCNEVWARSPDGVFDHVGDEACENQTYEEPEEGDVCFVCPWAEDECPYNENTEGYGGRVDEQPGY